MTTSITRSARASKAKPPIIDDMQVKREATSQAELEAEFSNTKRELIATVVGLLATGTCTYFGATLAASLSIAALVMTGSAFLSFMVYFIGVTVAIFAAIKAGARLQRVIVDGSLDSKVNAAQQYVVAKTSGWYNNATALFGAKGETT